MSQTTVVTVGYFLRLKKSPGNGLNEIQLCQKISGVEEILDHWFFQDVLHVSQAESWLNHALPLSHQILASELVSKNNLRRLGIVGV